MGSIPDNVVSLKGVTDKARSSLTIVDEPKDPDTKTMFTNPAAAAQEGVEKVIQTINRDRRVAVEKLNERIKSLDDRELGVIDENAIRNITRGLENIYVALSAFNGFLDMMSHDLIATMENVDASAVNTISTALHTQCMLDLLREKGIITDDEMKVQWEKTAPEYMKKMAAAGMSRTIPAEQS